MLDDRRSRVLEALVEAYIATGEPVSSQVILERSALAVSSATIRNDLARLESYGFVVQPHTSAGRIPTSAGFRYYVDHASPARLKGAVRIRIDDFFGDVHRELGRLLKETTGLLSDLAHYPAVVIGPGFSGESVRALHLVMLGESVLLAVTVSSTGRVSQDVVRLTGPVAPDDVPLAEQLLVEAFENQTIPVGADRAAALPVAMVTPGVGDVIAAVVEAMRSVDVNAKEVYIGGTAQLAELWQDLAHVHSILTLLEEESSIRDILGDESDATMVRLGDEMGGVGDVDLAVVSTPYDAGEHGAGRIGVLGPMRMNYRRTMTIVEEVGESLGDSIAR